MSLHTLALLAGLVAALLAGLAPASHAAVAGVAAAADGAAAADASPPDASPPTIACPTEPPVVRRLEIRERWRIDPDDPEAPLVSYLDQRNVLLHQGRLYLLDPQLCHVLVMGLDGEHLDTILREGEGPGEVRMPSVIMARRDGGLAVQHGYPTRVELVEVDGTPRDRWQLAANAWANRVVETPAGWFAIYQDSHQGDRPGHFVSTFHAALHDADGERTVSFFREERESHHQDRGASDEVAEHNPWHTAIPVSGDQVVLAAARDAYRLEWRGPDGRLDRVVTREFPAHRRTEAELAELKYRSYSIVGDEVRFKKQKLSPHEPVIRGLEWQPDGSLRVRTSFFARELPPGMVCRYEVHEPDGRLRERVEILDPTGTFDARYDAVALLDGEQVMILRNVMPAFRAATDAGMLPEVLEKRAPLPDDRADVAFAPIFCDLVPAAER